MPKKVQSLHDIQKKRMSKIPQVMNPSQNRARKYRSSSNWQTIRALQLRNEPLCFDPFGRHKSEGGAQPAVQVHHIRGVVSHYDLRAEETNLASICTGCHAKVESMERAGKATHYLFRRA